MTKVGVAEEGKEVGVSEGSIDKICWQIGYGCKRKERIKTDCQVCA